MRRFVFGLILLAGMPMPMAFAGQHVEHQHVEHAPSAAPASTAPSQRYATDATLRDQMRQIRGNVLALEDYAHGHLTQEVATQLADQIAGHVNTIIVNCKLPPDADAALHDIIGSLLQHASRLKADPNRIDAIAGMRNAIDQYTRTFDDPGFSEGNP